MPSISHTWGTTEQERQQTFPCDQLISDPDDALFRGVTINASKETVFRWLCQLRAAPYSYDLIDNAGRRSPPHLIEGLDKLAVGQNVMTIFELASFDRNRHLTIRMKSGSSASQTFGDIACSYLIVPVSPDSCRLLVKLIGKYPRGIKGKMMRTFLPWGDLFMMRRQLLNLKALAERP